MDAVRFSLKEDKSNMTSTNISSPIKSSLDSCLYLCTRHPTCLTVSYYADSEECFISNVQPLKFPITFSPAAEFFTIKGENLVVECLQSYVLDARLDFVDARIATYKQKMFEFEDIVKTSFMLSMLVAKFFSDYIYIAVVGRNGPV